MSGDLEDFLKRAAERRQAKAAQQAPPKRVPPQYSDSRTERVPRPAPTNDVVEAQIVSASGAEDVVVAEAVPVSQNRSDKAKSARRKKTAKKAAASRQTLSGREQRRAETETMSTPTTGPPGNLAGTIELVETERMSSHFNVIGHMISS